VDAIKLIIEKLFVARGMDASKAVCVTDALLIADGMGHTTHGLALAPWYLEALRSGAMTGTGDLTVINDRGSCLTWEGNHLPGAWLISKAMDVALERIKQHGVVTVAIRNSHHTGALAVYLPRLAELGFLVHLINSGPGAAGVAPFGGTRGVFTPNPMAMGIPTPGHPILIDISTSITTLNSARQLAARSERFPGAWAMDANGQPSDDPAILIDGGGTLLPVGGMDHGHKGYGMTLMAEAITQGLAGYGRADKPLGTTLGIFLQVIDPEAFAGSQAFERQTGWMVDACHANPPANSQKPVRLPGELGQARQAKIRSTGLHLSSRVVTALQPWVDQAGLKWPEPISMP
jgi:L-lactate dehydrogenase